MEPNQTLADEVVAAFGGTEHGSLTKAAAALRLPISTVDAWKRSGRIPSWRYPEIREAAARLDIKLPVEIADKAA